jgi:hypothetical protein
VIHATWNRTSKSKERSGSLQRYQNKKLKHSRSTNSFGESSRYSRQNTLREEKGKPAIYEFTEREAQQTKTRIELTQNLVQKQIQTTVDYLSQEGYISFPNFLQVLYLLQVTICLGRINLPNKTSLNRGKKYREQLEEREFEFATNMWNILNWYSCPNSHKSGYLFHFIDSSIWTDFLTILLSRDSSDNVELAEEYLKDVGRINNLPDQELVKNREMSESIYVKHPWSIARLFDEYDQNFKQPIQLTRNIKGPIRQAKMIETLNDHFKE